MGIPPCLYVLTAANVELSVHQAKYLVYAAYVQVVHFLFLIYILQVVFYYKFSVIVVIEYLNPPAII